MRWKWGGISRWTWCTWVGWVATELKLGGGLWRSHLAGPGVLGTLRVYLSAEGVDSINVLVISTIIGYSDGTGPSGDDGGGGADVPQVA